MAATTTLCRIQERTSKKTFRQREEEEKEDLVEKSFMDLQLNVLYALKRLEQAFEIKKGKEKYLYHDDFFTLEIATGPMWVCLPSGEWKEQFVLFIEHLIVEEPYCRLGYGSRIMRLLLDNLPTNGIYISVILTVAMWKLALKFNGILQIPGREELFEQWKRGEIPEKDQSWVFNDNFFQYALYIEGLKSLKK